MSMCWHMVIIDASQGLREGMLGDAVPQTPCQRDFIPLDSLFCLTATEKIYHLSLPREAVIGILKGLVP